MITGELVTLMVMMMFHRRLREKIEMKKEGEVSITILVSTDSGESEDMNKSFYSA
jgi:hypothetical protein